VPSLEFVDKPPSAPVTSSKHTSQTQAGTASQLKGVFGLAFVAEIVVGYNLIMHKTQSQKLIFLAFHSFLVDSTPKPQPPPLTQTSSKSRLIQS